MSTPVSKDKTPIVFSTSISQPEITPDALLLKSIQSNDLGKVQKALENRADPNSLSDDQDKYVLHIAAEKGNPLIVKELLNHGARVGMRSWKWRDTPLHRACVFGHADVAQELIKAKAEINLRNSNCWQTPLELAIDFKHLKCCEVLLNAKASPNERNLNHGSSPFITACDTQNYEIVKLLLSKGANPKKSSFQTALSAAMGSPSIVSLLVQYGVDVNEPNEIGQYYASGYRPLHKAALLAADESFELLLNAGADVDLGCVGLKEERPIDIAKWRLIQERTNPQNSSEQTASIIKRLENIIRMIEEKSKSTSQLESKDHLPKELPESKKNNISPNK
ncbi:MAG: ankyrin repeat domain-containing protein [Chlamydiota bacterium]